MRSGGLMIELKPLKNNQIVSNPGCTYFCHFCFGCYWLSLCLQLYGFSDLMSLYKGRGNKKKFAVHSEGEKNNVRISAIMVVSLHFSAISTNIVPVTISSGQPNEQ